jgi:hypothetical protein
MNIEQRLAQAIHFGALADAVPLNVDLDVILSVLAHTLCAALRRRLPGYTTAGRCQAAGRHASPAHRPGPPGRLRSVGIGKLQAWRSIRPRSPFLLVCCGAGAGRAEQGSQRDGKHECAGKSARTSGDEGRSWAGKRH